MKNTDSFSKNLYAHHFHRFLDEAGDTTFYGKGKIPLIGSNGVSNYFLLGMLSIHESLNTVRRRVIELQSDIVNDPYLMDIPSIKKKKNNKGYFLHAKDDVPEVRKMVFELIKSIDCQFDAVVGKKEYSVYEKKHNGNQSEFYADILSHLLHDSLNGYDRLVLNIAHRKRCTTHTNLEKGLQKAIMIASHKLPEAIIPVETVFNIQYPTTEPIINLTDYFLWALQRKMERDEKRYIDFIEEKVGNIIMLYGDGDLS
jgi:hypothetical protein